MRPTRGNGSRIHLPAYTAPRAPMINQFKIPMVRHYTSGGCVLVGRVRKMCVSVCVCVCVCVCVRVGVSVWV
jgi:hypothetical protein